MLLDTDIDSKAQKFKGKTSVKLKADIEENRHKYDIDQIHDLGFTLSPKPFNIIFEPRKV